MYYVPRVFCCSVVYQALTLSIPFHSLVAPDPTHALSTRRPSRHPPRIAGYTGTRRWTSAFSTRPVDGSYFDPARRLGKVLLFQGSFSKMNSADSRILPPFRGGVRWWTFRGHWLVSCEHYDLLSLNILEARPYLITDAVHSSTSIPTPFTTGHYHFITIYHLPAKVDWFVRGGL